MRQQTLPLLHPNLLTCSRADTTACAAASLHRRDRFEQGEVQQFDIVIGRFRL